MVDEACIKRAAQLILESIQVVVLTGAGISVESGIPDFRSPGGLWTKYDPLLYGTYESFVNHPERFWEMAKELNPTLENAEPNPAHYALAELERLGKCRAVITQNIDHLHQRAGSSDVLELHGTHRTGHCMSCSRAFTLEEMKELSKHGECVACCPEDEATIKPDVVFFGEPLNSKVLSRAAELASTSDLMLVVGCSLEVYPAAALPDYTKRRKGRLVFVNTIATYHDDSADLVCLGKAGEVLPAIVESYKKMAGLS
ncbi:MAG: NAD-dependent deacylase [Actinobacteria bacterium]|jgi:NAD-dependent deacetylase|nr:MAG: NAD-dependent deacylase [Actinomycetota bacterium]